MAPRPQLRNEAGIVCFCSHLNCTSPSYSRTLCKKHYRRWHFEQNREQNLEDSKKLYRRKREIRLAQTKKYKVDRYHRDPAFREHQLAKTRSWVKRNRYSQRQEVRKRKAKYREENKEKCREACRSHFRRNRAYYKAKTARRRATLLRATPKWSEKEAIDALYDACPAGSEVDHIEPLQGKDVCGLHVLDNLQYLPKTENRRKGNRRVTA